MKSLLVTAEAVARSALIRQESRGAHTRIDYEGERDEWVKVNIVCRKGADGQMEVEKVTRPPPVAYLEAIANSKIEDLESGKVGADAPND
jgi:succinate dehydrogenase / fumarate reductase flavoprotein subunit